MVKYLSTTLKQGYTSHGLSKAASNKYESIVRWLLEHGHHECSISGADPEIYDLGTHTNVPLVVDSVMRAIHGAAAHGHVAVLRYLYLYLEHKRWGDQPDLTAFVRAKLRSTLSSPLRTAGWVS